MSETTQQSGRERGVIYTVVVVVLVIAHRHRAADVPDRPPERGGR